MHLYFEFTLAFYFLFWFSKRLFRKYLFHSHIRIEEMCNVFDTFLSKTSSEGKTSAQTVSSTLCLFQICLHVGVYGCVCMCVCMFWACNYRGRRPYYVLCKVVKNLLHIERRTRDKDTDTLNLMKHNNADAFFF